MPMREQGHSIPSFLWQHHRSHPSRRSGASSRSRRLVRAGGDLLELLPAIARTVAESLGYESVVINVYRPAWDDFCVTTVHGSEAARRQLLGQVRGVDDWQRLLDDRFARCGAYVARGGRLRLVRGRRWLELCSRVRGGRRRRCLAAGGRALRPAPPHRRPPARDPLGRRADQPAPPDRRGTRSTRGARGSRSARAAVVAGGGELGATQARARALARGLVPAAGRAGRRRDPPSRLRAACATRSASRTCSPSCATVTAGSIHARAVGWSVEEIDRAGPVFLRDIEGLIDPAVRDRGLLPPAERRGEAAHLALERQPYSSALNGRGPWAWDHHWLLVPLHDSLGEVIGVLWADEPEDRLLPSRDTLQALRVFANQAAAAIVTSAHLRELRFLADHDPLTRLHEPPRVRRAARGRGRARAPVRPLVRARRLRPRRLQGAERPRRPSGGRRGVAALRADAPVGAAPRRRGVSDRRRRIRHSCSPRQRTTMRARSSGASPSSSRASARASAWRPAPSTRATRRRSSASPTWPSTRPSAAAPGSSSSRRLGSTGAEVRPFGARLGRASHLREGAERPLGVARLLDRGRVPGRERGSRRRLALHRAPALQGLAVLRRPADRRDLRRDGRGAERSHVARAHRRLLARAGPPRRRGRPRDDRHGVRARIRRPRPGARGRARGDRDVRGHAAGARPRSVLPGGLRRARAWAARDRDGRRDLDRSAAARSRAITARCIRAATSS